MSGVLSSDQGAILAYENNPEQGFRNVLKTDGSVMRVGEEEFTQMVKATEDAARLADLPGVLIGTANQAQGLERDAVVVIHPLAGYREAPAFATDPGRLCVALSRHRAHATIVVDVDTDAAAAPCGKPDTDSDLLRIADGSQFG